MVTLLEKPLREKPLRGVARRQAEEVARLHDDHETELVPLFRGVLAVAREKDFVAALMNDLRSPDWRDRLNKRRTTQTQNVAQLQQPIHREFAVALYEARCKIPGLPRVDPRKLVAQGMVVRKVFGNTLRGWVQSKTAQRGWMPVQPQDDPQGLKAQRSGNAAIDTLLALQNHTPLLKEEVTPLFVAPPDVCAALKKTVLFGVVPVTSSEQAESAPVDYMDLAKGDGGDLEKHLSEFLRPDRSPSPPAAGRLVDKDWDQTMFTTAIRQLVQEAGLEDETPEAAALRDVLANLGILSFVRDASPMLVFGRKNETDLRMPANWPRATPALRSAFYVALGARFKTIVSHVGKFDDRDATYQLHAFMRLTCGNCPPKLIWCKDTPTYSIVPWWAGSGPPTRIALPDFDLKNLPKLKPNVAFEVPQRLAKFLNQDFSNVLKEKPGDGGETGIAWICSFSIPIITICAFILLSIILALLNLLFFWLPLVKICLPFPKVKQSP
jgi:hypothetical protein